MKQSLKSAATLIGLLAMLAAGGAWGWTALTKPFPKSEPLPLCVPTPVKAGASLGTSDVVVSVFNATTRAGLASKVMSDLVDRGFVQATMGNAPAKTSVARVEIWTDEPDNPAVALVARQFKKPRLVPDPRGVGEDPLGLGVVVVVGDRFQKMLKPTSEIPIEANATICSPPAA